MGRKQYYCPGSCGGTLDVEEWFDAAPKCQAATCERQGQPLSKREV